MPRAASMTWVSVSWWIEPSSMRAMLLTRVPTMGSAKAATDRVSAYPHLPSPALILTVTPLPLHANKRAHLSGDG